MVTPTQAIEIHKRVRNFFKWEPKSSNKQYDILKNPDKESIRHEYHKVAWERFATLRAGRRDMSLAEEAEAIAKLGSGGRVGNCHEMALVACLYAKDVLPTGIWLGSIGGLGNHAFCLLGPTTDPTWTCTLYMSLSTDIGAWVVDPWANVCCDARTYHTDFCRKMEDWGDGGKQILSKGGWVDPASWDYKTGFLIGDLSFALVY
jgi:hypothetical protein